MDSKLWLRTRSGGGGRRHDSDGEKEEARHGNRRGLNAEDELTIPLSAIPYKSRRQSVA